MAGPDPEKDGVLVCDSASWHHQGGTLSVPDTITLLSLPAYAPELNPMKNFWEYMHANTSSRLVWDSHEAIVAARKQAWDFLIEDPARIIHRHTRLGMRQCLAWLV